MRRLLIVSLLLAFVGCNVEPDWQKDWDIREPTLTEQQEQRRDELLAAIPGYPYGFKSLIGESASQYEELFTLAKTIYIHEQEPRRVYDFGIPDVGDGGHGTTLSIMVEGDCIKDISFEMLNS